MTLRKFVKAQAKAYAHLPWEMKIPLAILLYILLLLLKLSDFLVRLKPLKKKLSGIRFNLWFHPKRQRGRPKKSFLKKIRQIIVFTPSPLFRLKIRSFLTGCLFSFVVFFLPLVTWIFLQDLPNPKELTLRAIPQTTKILDRNGRLLYEIYASQNRTMIKLPEVPKYLQEATLAIEDKNFYHHPGFDAQAIIRAFWENLSGKKLQGGSTITQQLVKSSLLTPEQTLERKIKELLLAFWAERVYSKKQILEMYFNQVPYGGTAWGIEAAAETYFGKKVQNLDLAESAFLAGLTSAPTVYSPFGPNPTLWKKRQEEVLSRMVDLKYISRRQMRTADNEKLTFRTERQALYAPHFVNFVKELLVQRYGLAMVEKGGLTVTTTLDLPTEQMAEKIVREEVDTSQKALHMTNGAALVTNPQTGDILAMVGSKDYNDPDGGNVNATTALRQPGSTVKVITYSAALEKGLTPVSILDDSPTTFTSPFSPPYTPVNYDGKFRGKVPLRFALANSLNIPAVKVLNLVGIPNMVSLGKKMGVQSWGNPNQYGLSVTLGGAETTMLDLATVFGTLANEGARVNLNPILRITDYRGNVLEEKKYPNKKQVLNPGIAFIISNILSDNQARSYEFGADSPLFVPGHTVAVKTGTSDNKRDNWTVGYTNNIVVAVWVGNMDGSPMDQALASGITGAAPIWHRIISDILTKRPEQKPTIPQDIVQKNCLGRNEYFLSGTEKTANCLPVVAPAVYPSSGH